MTQKSVLVDPVLVHKYVPYGRVMCHSTAAQLECDPEWSVVTCPRCLRMSPAAGRRAKQEYKGPRL